MTIVDRVWRWLYEVKDISLKTDKLLAFLWPWSNLLHSMIVDGKNKFLKNLWFVLKRGIFSAFLVEHNVRLKGSKLKKYRGCSLFKKCEVFCTNDELERTQNQVLDIFSLSKNP